MFCGDKRVLAFIVTVAVSATAAATYVMVRALIEMKGIAIPIHTDGTTICVPTNIRSDLYAFWIPMLVAEITYCALALYRGFHRFRGERSILKILIRDSLYYFIIIFATYLTNTLIFLLRPSSEVEIPIGFSVALSSVMASRMCLNLHRHVHRRDEDLDSSSFLSIAPADAAQSPARSHPASPLFPAGESTKTLSLSFDSSRLYQQVDGGREGHGQEQEHHYGRAVEDEDFYQLLESIDLQELRPVPPALAEVTSGAGTCSAAKFPRGGQLTFRKMGCLGTAANLPWSQPFGS
ncbi:uncharacterized protein BXZ73DRAFT_80346 [Epithele typhae]|uniref:uncharacterized protein n=1 Tax=Epithele typhae TaxID=378194 RepID=UPI002008AE18|nr:uncharacterized protein BXZ73DRAFT_80346 [Epithele typhae]KAH9919474.1 hypothetical protein BXZ73DRAFT_80346 [Epithele typhae]